MAPEDAEERIAELERELAEAKREAAEYDRAAPNSDGSYVQLNPGAHDYISPADSHGAPLVSPPRKVPAAFRLAEVLPFRWWYVWTLFMVAIAPIALWHAYPVAFVAVAVITLVAIYGFQFQAAATRFTLLKWGQVATVTGTEMLSRGTYYSGTTWSNVYLPVAHGWKVTRQRWSGPSTKTRIRYTLNGYQGELVVRGREYIDGVVLADQRNPARARCVTSFAYDLDRDESGNWLGRLRPRLKVGMICWLVIVIGWLALAAIVAANIATGAAAITSAPGGKIKVGGNNTTQALVCNDSHVTVGGNSNTITATGHCASLTVSGSSNQVSIESADTISTSGVGNAITYQSGTPRVTTAGVSNTVSRR